MKGRRKSRSKSNGDFSAADCGDREDESIPLRRVNIHGEVTNLIPNLLYLHSLYYRIIVCSTLDRDRTFYSQFKIMVDLLTCIQVCVIF